MKNHRRQKEVVVCARIECQATRLGSLGSTASCRMCFSAVILSQIVTGYSLACVVQMKKCMELEEKLKTMDREISVNPQYVQKVSNAIFAM